MDVKPSERIPVFSVSEVLGYLAPAGALILSVALFEAWVTRLATLGVIEHSGTVGGAVLHTPLKTGFSALAALLPSAAEVVNSASGGSSYGWFLMAILAVSILLGTYVLGHVLDAFGSLLLDRTLIYKGYGYPYEILFGYPDVRPKTRLADPRSATVLSRAFYRGLFFYINAYFLLRWFGYFRLTGTAATTESQEVHSYAGTLAEWITLMVLIKIVSSVRDASWWPKAAALIERGLTTWPRAKRTLDLPMMTRLRTSVGTLSHAIMVALFSLPYELAVAPLTAILRTRSAFGDELRTKYEQAFERIFQMKPEAVGSNNYWFAYTFVFLSSRRISLVLSGLYRQYWFMRNLAVAFYIAFIYSMIWLYLTRDLVTAWTSQEMKTLLVLPLVFFGLAFAALIQYYYIYVAYFSKTLFRSFVVVATRNRVSAS